MGKVLENLSGNIMTVTGAIDSQEMGFTLPHEQVMSTFGAKNARDPQYNRDKLFSSLRPCLNQVKNISCQILSIVPLPILAATWGGEEIFPLDRAFLNSRHFKV